MSNVYPIQSKQRLYDTACDWLACVDRGLSVAEEQDLASWLAQGQAQRAAFIEVAHMWDAMDSLQRLAHLFPLAEHEPLKHRFSPRSFALAASVILLLSMSYVITTFPSMGRVIGVELAEREFRYQTHVGERQTVSLNDGSEVVLNTDTIVRVAYSDGARLLLLDKGEIHVEVAHDDVRPFSVMVNDQLVQAVGTAFTIEVQNSDSASLIVTNGKVLVSSTSIDQLYSQATALAASGVKVARGQQLQLSREAGTTEAPVEMDAAAMDAALAWQRGSLVFSGETLQVAVQELSRYNALDIMIANPSVAQLRIAGVYQTQDIDGFLASLEANFDIGHEWESETAVLLVASKAKVK